MQIDSFLVIYLILARIFELIVSYKNTRRLLDHGAKEYYAFHYRFIVLFHFFFIVYFFNKSFHDNSVDFEFAIMFFLLQILRYKVLYDLGKFWTTRIIVVKEIPLIKTGIYKYIKHPNYLIVFFEIPLICLIFLDYEALIFFTIINSILILVRIYFEEKANSVRLKKDI